jgi:hypothetical protein
MKMSRKFTGELNIFPISSREARNELGRRSSCKLVRVQKTCVPPATFTGLPPRSRLTSSSRPSKAARASDSDCSVLDRICSESQRFETADIADRLIFRLYNSKEGAFRDSGEVFGCLMSMLRFRGN